MNNQHNFGRQTATSDQLLAEVIEVYVNTIQTQGNPAAGYHIATGCNLLADLPALAKITLGVCHHGAKPAAVSLNIVDAICLRFSIDEATLAAKMVKFGREVDRANWDNWPAERLQLKARLALGNWLLDMVQRAGIYEVVRGDNSLAEEAHGGPTEYLPSVSIKRAKGKKNKRFQAKGVTATQVQQIWNQAAVWRDTEGEPADRLVFNKPRSRGQDEGDEKVWSREPYYLRAINQALTSGAQHLSTEPFKPWASKANGGEGCIDSHGRKLMESRFFKLDDRQLDQPWVHAINRLESVGYRVNQPMLNLLQQLQQAEEADPKAPKVFNTDNPKKMTHRLDAMKVAKELGEQAFYNRAFVDFRGRVYLSKSALQFQGADFVRSLIDLKNSEPLTDSGLDSLLLHTANCDGRFDEHGRHERIAKARQIIDHYKRIGSNPMAHLADWINKDKPFCFIRACMELAHVSVGQPSSILVEQDGSNNGLAWQAIMMGDMEMAKQTNLLGGPKQDLYQIVGKALKPKYPDTTQAERRQIAKIAVMRYGYGAGTKTIATDIRDWVIDHPRKAAYLSTLDLTDHKAGRDWQPSDPFMQIAKDAVAELEATCSGTKAFKETIKDWYADHMVTTAASPKFKEKYFAGEEVKAPKALRRVIETFQRGVIDPDDRDAIHDKMLDDWAHGKHVGYRAITYVTPSGFPVHIEKTKSIKMASDLKVAKGKTVSIVAYWSDGTPNVNGDNGMISSSLANAVHSFDATHVHMTLNAADFEVATVHDAFACHPNNASALRTVLMEQLKILADQHPLRILMMEGMNVGILESAMGHAFMLEWPWLEYHETVDGKRRAPLIDLDSDEAHDRNHANIPSLMESPCVDVNAPNAFS